MANIAMYGSHNGGIAVENNGEIVLVLEIERLLAEKNMGIAQYKVPPQHLIVEYMKRLTRFITQYTGIDEFENCFYQNTDVCMDEVHYEMARYIPAKNFIYKLHHEAHAAGAFYQSPFDKALIFSFDGGGNDGKFNIYTADRKTGLQRIRQILNPVLNNPHIHYDFGFPYMSIGHFLEDIRFESIGDGNLVYPGKLMGLVSYGKVRQEWLQHFIQYYKINPDGSNYVQHIQWLGHCLNSASTEQVVFDVNNRIKGQLAYDIAATNQAAFEACFFEVADSIVAEHSDYPICITGGCGLNIILNTRVAERYGREVFVGPGPNDCGLAVGMLLEHLKPKKQVDITYSGTKLLDLDALLFHAHSGPYSKITDVSIKKLAEDLSNGIIVGVARGRAEHGPRALGNRSILCNPSIPNMKDTLNEKVKNREWYRPFAPVVRLEDVDKYFEWDKEARFMSFCPNVKEEWKEKLQAITHVDGTARVQTVTKQQNEWLYNLLTEFEKLTGVGVLLNTSFNVAGKPILNTVAEAFQVYKTTRLDALVIEDTYIVKL